MRRYREVGLRIGGTIVAYGVSQILIGAAAFLRIPLLIDHFGTVVFGFFSVVVGLWPWFNVPWDALRQAARVRAAEDPRASIAPRAAVLSVSQSTRVSAVAVLALAAVVGISPYFSDLARTSRVEPGTALLAALSLGLAAATGCFLAPHLGVAEFRGFTTRANISFALSALLGLPAIILGIGHGWSLPALVAITAFSYVLPLAAIRWWVRLGAKPAVAQKESLRAGDRAVRRMAVWSSAGVLGMGLDTLIVGIVLGPVDAGTYAVVQRVLVLALIVPTALGGLVTSYFARLRMAETSETTLRSVSKVCGLYCLGGGAMALGFLLVGPRLVDSLTRGQLAAPPELFAAFSLMIFFHYATSPLLASMTSSSGLKARNAIYILASVLNLALSLTLPRFVGISGPALASAVAGGLVLVITYLRLRRHAQDYFGQSEQLRPEIVR